MGHWRPLLVRVFGSHVDFINKMKSIKVQCRSKSGEVLLPPLTYCGRGHAPYGHGEAQQGVVLVLGQSQ